MSDRRQVELAHDLRAAAQSEFSQAAGAINRRYAELRLDVRRRFDREFDECRAKLIEARSEQPRDLAKVEFLQGELRRLRARPLPEAEIKELEAARLAEVNALDRVLKFKFADIDMRVRRGLLEDRMEWSAAEQKFVIPTPEPSHAA